MSPLKQWIVSFFGVAIANEDAPTGPFKWPIGHLKPERTKRVALPRAKPPSVEANDVCAQIAFVTHAHGHVCRGCDREFATVRAAIAHGRAARKRKFLRLAVLQLAHGLGGFVDATLLCDSHMSIKMQTPEHAELLSGALRGTGARPSDSALSAWGLAALELDVAGVGARRVYIGYEEPELAAARCA